MSNLWVIPEELGDFADSEYAYEACKASSYLMWALSGRKFNNINIVTERYEPAVRESDRNERYNMTSGTAPVYNAAILSARVPAKWLRLRGTPVQEVVKITYLDSGNIIPNTTYTVVDKTWVHFDSYISTPVVITYKFGVNPPTAGRMAARKLAIEFAKSWVGADDCELPDRVTSVTRQGISMTILDNQDFIQELRTGVYSVDLFLKSVNPDSARARPKVFAAGMPSGRRTQGRLSSLNDLGGWTIIPEGGGI